MKASAERYFPRLTDATLLPFEPFISYEHWHRYSFAVPFITGKIVLDIASGEGYGSAFLAEHATEVHGIDASQEAIEHARRSYERENLRFLHGTADAIPIVEEHCFDVIVSFETIEHLDLETQQRFAREVKRLLKPDGILLISTPNRITYTDAKEQKNPYHLHEFTQDEVLEFLHESFAHVRLLSQHVYPMSYIWNLEGPSGPLTEYQLALNDGAFQPSDGRTKEVGYLIAVCSDCEEATPASDSFLIDLSEVAFRGIPERDRWQMTTLFLDTGAGFRAEEVIREQAEFGPEFTITFTLDPSAPVRQLRWDPVESRVCQVLLRRIEWADDQGRTRELHIDQVSSNGLPQDQATIRFETLDPMIYLPIAGSVTRLTIQGECRIETESRSLFSLEQGIQARDRQIQTRDQQIQARDLQIQARDLQIAQRDHDLRDSRDLIATQAEIIASQAERISNQSGRIATQAERIKAQADQITTQAGQLAAQTERIAAQAQLIESFRDQLAQRDGDLQAARGQIAAQDQSIAAQEQSIATQGQLFEACQVQLREITQRFLDCERRLEESEHSVRMILNSKRWVYINRVRAAVYFLPGILSRSKGTLKRRRPGPHVRLNSHSSGSPK